MTPEEAKALTYPCKVKLTGDTKGGTKILTKGEVYTATRFAFGETGSGPWLFLKDNNGHEGGWYPAPFEVFDITPAPEVIAHYATDEHAGQF